MENDDYEQFFEEAITRAFNHKLPKCSGSTASGSGAAGASWAGNLNQPAVPAPPPPPVHMRASKRLHYSKFNTNFIPAEIILSMSRNQVVPSGSRLVPNNMIEWCEENCSALWMPSPPSAPEYIMFESPEDMDLFLMAFGGGSR